MNHDKPIFSQPQTGAEMYAAPESTYLTDLPIEFSRRDFRDFIQNYLTNVLGQTTARQYSENIAGADPNNPMPRNPMGIGLADFTPLGLLFAGQEIKEDFSKASRPLDYVAPTIGGALSIVEAYPLTKVMVKGVASPIASFLRNINRKSVDSEAGLEIPKMEEPLMTSPGPKTVRDDESNLEPPKGISRRGVLQGLAAAPVAAGVLGELPISKVASKVAKVKVPDIVPKSLLTKLSVFRNKVKLGKELQLDIEQEMNLNDPDRMKVASNMRKFLKGEFEPEELSEIGVSRGYLLNGPASKEHIDFLFKNKADKKKYLELDRKRKEASDKAFGIYDGANEALLQGKSTAKFDPKVMVEQQEIERKTEIEMFKFLRDASKENRLSDDFFRKSNFKPMYSTRLDSDPLDSAEIYYKQRVDAKKLLGDGFDEIPYEELKKMSSDAVQKRNSLGEFVRSLPRDVPTPPKVSAEMKKLMEEREVIDGFINAKFEPRAYTAAKRQEIINYQKENNFTDEEMLGLMERSIEKAGEAKPVKFRSGLEKSQSTTNLRGLRETTERLLEKGE